MPTVVPESDWGHGQERLAAALGEALDALLEVTNASAGWVGLIGTDGRLVFPTTRGRFSPAWLTLQQGQGIWGFEIREGCSLLNDLPPLPALGEPALTNLLSCPLSCQGTNLGHVVLANKPSGFGSPDSSVALGVAHLMSKWLRPTFSPSPRRETVPTVLLQLALDRATEGVLIVDASGTLLYANGTWASWTGFRAEELLQRPAPFPFWISHRELIALGPHPSAVPLPSLGVFPFRHRSDTIFWCQVETLTREVEGKPFTVAFLRRVAETTAGPADRPLQVHYSFLDAAADLPFALVLTDRQGTVLWANPAFADIRSPSRQIQGRSLRSCFTSGSLAELEHLFRTAEAASRGQRGRLMLGQCDEEGREHDLLAYWLAVAMPGSPGFLFAFSADWQGLCPPDDVAAAWQRVLHYPNPGQLALLIQPGAEVQFWDERWQALTGLPDSDVAGAHSETVLDWLFPRQQDRDRVADLLHQPPSRGARPGCQAVLEVLTRTGSRPLLCTFLPILGPNPERWLLLAGPSESMAGEEHPAMTHVRQFARGLSHLLNHFLATPLGLAEMALDRTDLMPEQTALFAQMLQSCRSAVDLVSLLQDLGAQTPGDMQRMSLADLVCEFLDEAASAAGERSWELKLDLRDRAVQVRVNRRMLKTVLAQLVLNAEQAMTNRPQRRIEVRVFAREDAACCEIEDTGEGLPTDEWTRLLAPFYSTKGPFARDPAHAALEGTGLGLTVSQHLLALHGGRLELRGKPGEGTVATMVLPRGDLLPARTTSPGDEDKRIRADAPTEPAEPHAAQGLTPALEPPAPEKEK